MNTSTIFKVVAGVGILLGVLAFFGFTPFGKQVVTQFVGSPAGTTFSTAKFAGVAVSLAAIGANGTSTSILNGDASDRFVSGWRLGCEGLGTSRTVSGVGLANLLLTIGTTTGSSPTAPSTFAAVANNYIVPTTTGNLILAIPSVASSTIGGTATTTNATVWPSGSYMTFTFNATNTAACTVGVDYVGA